VMLIDLDRFKEVNDSFGHVTGGRLLREVGSRPQARMRDGDTLARLGGDEFAILVDNTAPEDARAIADGCAWTCRRRSSAMARSTPTQAAGSPVGRRPPAASGVSCNAPTSRCTRPSASGSAPRSTPTSTRPT
jgi:diguanylate cyclase (GGDEF)-like protein